MNKKIIALLIVLTVSVCCLSIVSADNNTTDDAAIADNASAAEEIQEDLANYILPLSITGNGIEFSDGFTGFCLDLSKDSINAEDRFTSQATTGTEVENHVKLAIIECYKTGHENDIQNMVNQVIKGNKEYDVVESVYSSTENVADTATVDINNDTQATFTFELLKSQDSAKSDCLAYKVSLQTVENDDVLAAGDDEANDTIETAADNDTQDNDNLTIVEGNDTPTEQQDGNDSQTTENNDTEKKESQTTENNDTKQQDINGNNQSGDKQTIVNETNKTIVNKTNTIIVNETNTTIINKNNTKVINKTNETPQNATVQNQIMRAVGNPIFLLVVVIAIIAVVAVVIRRKN